MLLREYAIKWWLVIPPLLTNVSALPGETWTPRIVSFQSCCIPWLETTLRLLLQKFPEHAVDFRLLLGRKSVHCSVASQLTERPHLCTEQCKVVRHRSWTPVALSADVLLVADGVRCCLETGMYSAVLHRAGDESTADTEMMSVEDIASQSSAIFKTRYTAWLKRQFPELMFLQVVQRHQLEMRDNKSPFVSILSQQHLCQKLPKSVDVHWSYSVQHQCRFLRHRVDGFKCAVSKGKD